MTLSILGMLLMVVFDLQVHSKRSRGYADSLYHNFRHAVGVDVRTAAGAPVQGIPGRTGK